MTKMLNLRRGGLVLLAALATLAAALPLHGTETPLPSEPPGLTQPDPGPVDGCACLTALKRCIRDASADLDSCLEYAPDPGRDLLCYLRFDVEVQLCLDDPGDCSGICEA